MINVKRFISMIALLSLFTIFVLTGCGTQPTIEVNNTGGNSIVAGSLEPNLQHKVLEDGSHEFTFSVKNQTERVITLNFTSGERYDYILKNEAGEVIDRLSMKAQYIQALGTEELKQGESLEYKETLPALEKGKYTIEFMITDTEFKPSASIEFEVE